MPTGTHTPRNLILTTYVTQGMCTRVTSHSPRVIGAKNSNWYYLTLRLLLKLKINLKLIKLSSIPLTMRHNFPHQVFMLYPEECIGHMQWIFWITEVIHPSHFDPTMVTRCFPGVVRGMIPFLLNGNNAKGDKSRLRAQFDRFCDLVGRIQAATRQ